jgi:hypothetical protein
MFGDNFLVGDATGRDLQVKELVRTFIPSPRRILDRAHF